MTHAQWAKTCFAPTDDATDSRRVKDKIPPALRPMFLNSLMLIGVVAAAVPVVLHLLSRARYRTVDWGAMMFLDGSEARQRQSSRLNQWLLLLVRMALVALLAVALARPVVQGNWAAPAQGQRVIAVILLDCSPSMAYEENGHSRMVVARGAAKQILGLHKGDRAALVLMGQPQQAIDRQPTADLWDVARRIDAATPGYSRADIARALNDSLDAIEAAEGGDRTTDAADASDRGEPAPARAPAHAERDHPFVRFYVISDRQATSWRDVDDAFASAWKERLHRDALAGRTFVVPIGSPEADNVAIESLELMNGPAVAGQPAEVEVKVHNFGDAQWASLPLTITAQGADRARVLDSRINLLPNSAATYRATVTFDQPGTHVLAADVNRQSSTAGQRPTGFTADDHLDTIVDVVEPVKVLVISGDERSGAGAAAANSSSGGAEPFSGEADYLQLALAPFKAAKKKGGDLSTVDVAPADAWEGPSVMLRHRGGGGADKSDRKPEKQDASGPPVRLSAYRVVVLANIEQFSPAQVQALRQFVYDGGGLLIAPGNLSRPRAYNDALYRGGEGILPASLREPTSEDGSEQTSLSGFDAQHPVFRFLSGRPDAFLDASIMRYFPTDAIGPQARVLARYVSGDPFLLEFHPVRGGKVLLMTTSLDADWTTLPLTSFYLPFVQSAVRYLAETTPRRVNLAPGDPIEVQFDEPVAGRTVKVVTPDGAERSAEILRPGDLAVARFTETEQPGLYSVKVVEPGRKVNTIHFAVRPDRSESDMTSLGEDGWHRVEHALDAERLDPMQRALSTSAAAVPKSRELWAWLLGAVFLLALLEMTLARRWSADEGGDDDASALQAA